MSDEKVNKELINQTVKTQEIIHSGQPTPKSRPRPGENGEDAQPASRKRTT